MCHLRCCPSACHRTRTADTGRAGQSGPRSRGDAGAGPHGASPGSWAAAAPDLQNRKRMKSPFRSSFAWRVTWNSACGLSDSALHVTPNSPWLPALGAQWPSSPPRHSLLSRCIQLGIFTLLPSGSKSLRDRNSERAGARPVSYPYCLGQGSPCSRDWINIFSE